MIDIRRDIGTIIDKIMSGLKDFQQATVKHIDSLYRAGQTRILVSDEVGLGKTLIARGLVANLAKLRLEEGDNLFKVIYICSNAAIAGQNIRKLRVTHKARVESTSASRLSMQHLHIFRQEHDPELLENFIQLIPLTPETSFRMTTGTGAVRERALMFALLRRQPLLAPYLQALEVLMTAHASVAWEDWAKEDYEGQVLSCDQVTGGKYLDYMQSRISSFLQANDHELLHDLINHLNRIKANKYKWIRSGKILGRLRVMFAQISIDLLDPDFVIMDEFQRFKYLLESDQSSETGMLAQRFFRGDDIRMLLLSATPYKMYSTLEEINELDVDEHYSEFFEVLNFLKPCEIKQKDFNKIWENYSIQLREFTKGNTSIVEAKRAAEDALFEVVSRTERISAEELADIIDDQSTKTYLMPKDSDIKSFLEMQKLLDNTVTGIKVPVDYIKSSPFIMSFMQDYQLKKQLEKYFIQNPENLKLAQKKHLWVKRSEIEKFSRLNQTNARLKYVEDLAFQQNAEQLLWVTPSRPYYELTGPFKGAENFSKILIFSSWQMVPRMIATMISYESERKNVQKIARRSPEKSREVRYFSSETSGRRYPASRLNFTSSHGEPRGMPLFCLLYPAKRLAECFDPIEVINRKLSLREIKTEIKFKIQRLLDDLKYKGETTGREDERWYYLAPILFDDPTYVSQWISSGQSLADYVDLESDQTIRSSKHKQTGFEAHLEALSDLINDPNLTLGRQPADLLDVLTNVALSAPAVCAMRTYLNVGGDDYTSDMPSQFAKVFINRMNTPESTAVIEVVYGKSTDDAHWKNLLQYCTAGNLQAVLDEYAHILVESNGLANIHDRTKPLHDLIMTSLNVHTASYRVDTYSALKGRVTKYHALLVNIRTHFAVAFTKSDGGISRGTDRREIVRNSFNSPFRPFVLASTSIGQEGLDFHYYCRKIVHWNLPSNPIDIEQREGRINRYKCLAIRQNIADRYGDTELKNNVWYEMFEKASVTEKQANGSDLVPYWGLIPTQDMIKIERIVPMYPFSQEIAKYERLIKILSHYRLTLGQPRQEELLEYLFSEYADSDTKDLFINLSPFYKLNANSI